MSEERRIKERRVSPAIDEFLQERGELLSRIAELEQDGAALAASYCDGVIGDDYGNAYCKYKKELAALKEQQRGGVVLPNRCEIRNMSDIEDAWKSGWNACIKEIALLNPPGECVAVTKELAALAWKLAYDEGDAAGDMSLRVAKHVAALLRPANPGECVAVPVEPHNIAQQVREALDRKACPDAWMVVAYEATVRAILAQQGKEVGDE